MVPVRSPGLDCSRSIQMLRQETLSPASGIFESNLREYE
jgi:hypothetical protein